LSVHAFSLTGNTFTRYTLSIRYDPAPIPPQANEGTVKIWQYTAGLWSNVTAALVTTAKTVTTTARTNCSQFAVTVDAPPAPRGGTTYYRSFDEQAGPGRFGNGNSASQTGITNALMDPRRGSVAFWVRPMAPTPYNFLDSYPGSNAYWEIMFSCAWDPGHTNSRLQCTFGANWKTWLSSSHVLPETLVSTTAVLPVGAWVHAVWTWTGMEHSLYLNGTKVASNRCCTPSPYRMTDAGRITPRTNSAPYDELVFYNFALTPEEAAAAWAKATPGPITPLAYHGLTITAAWGPGEKKVHVTADSGHEYEATATSDEYELWDTDWIGNTLGVTDQVQPPWTPIVVSNLTLAVWGREPIQVLTRQADGDVEFECRLAAHALTLTNALATDFGYEAFPVKPLPDGWRSTYVNHSLIRAWPDGPTVPSALPLWWLWSSSAYDSFRGGIFKLCPDYPEAYADATAGPILAAPFVNQHVVIPGPPHDALPQSGWPYLLHLLGDETANDGWTAIPTRGMRDYWAWQLDTFIGRGGMEGICIDEANGATCNADLLTGSGYIKADGTHGYGHNTQGMREQIKRTRQLFLDHGRMPIVWIPVYGGVIVPHAHAFADIACDGEAYLFNTPSDPDFIEAYGTYDATTRVAGAGGWLLATGQAQKFGLVPLFLDEIKFYGEDAYVGALGAMYGLLSLLDILPINAHLGWWYHERSRFGVASPNTRFHAYHEQTAIVPNRVDVVCSYYEVGNRVLATVANLGKTSFSGEVAVRRDELRLSPRHATVQRVIGHPVYPASHNSATSSGQVAVLQAPRKRLPADPGHH
jgi:hypothetical protein